jgi:hypothetical protein
MLQPLLDIAPLKLFIGPLSPVLNPIQLKDVKFGLVGVDYNLPIWRSKRTFIPGQQRSVISDIMFLIQDTGASFHFVRPESSLKKFGNQCWFLG